MSEHLDISAQRGRENFQVFKAHDVLLQHESHLPRKCVSDEARGSSNVSSARRIRRELSMHVYLLAESVYAVPLKYLGVELVVARFVLRVHVAGEPLREVDPGHVFVAQQHPVEALLGRMQVAENKWHL